MNELLVDVGMLFDGNVPHFTYIVIDVGQGAMMLMY